MQEREEELRAGAEQARKLAADMEAIQKIRNAKLAALQDAGVDPLYTVELAGYDPTVRIKQDYKLGASKVKPAAKT